MLDSHGFADLLERSEFMHRINEQDRVIIRAVKTAKDETAATTKRLAKLEDRAQKVAAAILARRDEVAAVKGRLQSTQSGLADARAGKQAALNSTRSSRHKLEEDVRAMQAQQARIQGDLAGGRSPDPPGLGALHLAGQRADHLAVLRAPGVGGVPPRHRHRRPVGHADPRRRLGHRADRAPSYGGYGNYTCIQHTASLSTCYGHQSSFAVSVGQSVVAGPGHRLLRLHRPLLRPAPALRGAHQRGGRRPDGLPVAAR